MIFLFDIIYRCLEKIESVLGVLPMDQKGGTW